MQKFLSSYIGFREIPDEISLCINITNCPHKCEGCHSPELREDCGEPLTYEALDKLIETNKGVSCVCFMGEGGLVFEILDLAHRVRKVHNLKTAWYTGMSSLPHDESHIWREFDYLKIGEYMKQLGPLDNPKTNQRLYKTNGHKYHREDITYKFWRNEIKDKSQEDRLCPTTGDNKEG